VVRGVGFAVGIKNLAFSEAFDDFAEVRAVLTADGIEIHTAAAEVGQGLVTVIEQIARTATGISNVSVVWDHTGQIGSAGSTSASRQTQMTGGATLGACEAVVAAALARADADSLDDEGAWRDDQLVMTLADLVADGPIERLERFRHPPTSMPDGRSPPTGRWSTSIPNSVWFGWSGSTPPRTSDAPSTRRR
jgi:CO/xanthine dehydrogenase Mo-binding subunit